MIKKNILVVCTMILVIIISFIFFFSNEASADTLYGCPKDEIVMLQSAKCPDGSVATEVKEGYICDGDRVVLNTFSKERQNNLGIKGDNKFVVVIYISSSTDEASFTPGKDSLGKPLEKTFVELKYDCGAKGLSTKFLSSKCTPLGDTEEDLKKEKKEKKLTESLLRESIKRSIEQSWPIFYKQNKDAGLTDGEIKAMWEEYKKKVYGQYNYDPVTGKFREVKPW